MEEFLKELSELSTKYDLYIGGCGCCGSPWIASKDSKRYEFYLHFNEETKEYEV